MKKRYKIAFCVTLSFILFSLFLGVVSAKGITVTFTPTFSSPIDEGDFIFNISSSGGPAVDKFTATISDGTITHVFYLRGWVEIQDGNTATWEATSGRFRIGNKDTEGFKITWDNDDAVTSFTGTWQAFDKKGNIIDQGTFGWTYVPLT